MTIFDMRALAEAVAPALAVLPAGEAAELEAQTLAYIRRKRPATTAAQWRELLEGTGHLAAL